METTLRQCLQIYFPVQKVLGTMTLPDNKSKGCQQRDVYSSAGWEVHQHVLRTGFVADERYQYTPTYILY